MLRLLGILALGNMICGNRRGSDSFLGGLFLLPALMLGGWITIVVVGGIFRLIGSVIGGIFSGLAAIASGAFSGSGLVIGIMIGFVAFCWFRSRNAQTAGDPEEE